MFRLSEAGSYPSSFFVLGADRVDVEGSENEFDAVELAEVIETLGRGLRLLSKRRPA
ncbi:hypothetical protein Are01nite_88350 [Actinoplanes regularis]|nr:hypothetical protein Are01nite_88350 [Actinoplanes regularis]